jgi:hypothetical protein
MTNSGNDRLRAAMLAARLDVDAVADAIRVDPKSVRRWLTGGVPYPKLRFALAQLLSEDPEFLWPTSARRIQGTVTEELVAMYGNRIDMPLEEWRDLLRGARRQIELLGYALLFLPEQHPGLIGLLTERASQGCAVRIMMAESDAPAVRERDSEEGLSGGLVARISTGWTYFSPLIGVEGISFRSHRAPLYNSLFRFDDEMLVTPHIYATPGSRAPLFRLRRLGPDGVFDKFVSHFENLWARNDPDAEPVASTSAPTQPDSA